MFLRGLFGIFLLFSVRHLVHGGFSIHLVAEEISKLIKTNFRIAISINSSNDGVYLPVDESTLHASQELRKIRFRYFSSSKLINLSYNRSVVPCNALTEICLIFSGILALCEMIIDPMGI